MNFWLALFTAFCFAEQEHAPRLLPPNILQGGSSHAIRPFFDRYGRRIDRCYWGQRPTLVVVGAEEGHKALTQTFMTEFYTEKFASKLRGMGKGLLDKPSAKPAEPNPQFIFLTDPRCLWEKACAEGWKQARMMAHEKAPRLYDSYGVPQGLLSPLLERAFQKRAQPEIDKKVPDELLKRVDAEMEKSEAALMGQVPYSQYKLGGLMPREDANPYFAALGIEKPSFQVMIINTDGTVVRRWNGSEVKGKEIFQEYEQWLGMRPATKIVCDADQDGVNNYDDLCPNTNLGEKVDLPAGKNPRRSGCAEKQLIGSGKYTS